MKKKRRDKTRRNEERRILTKQQKVSYELYI